MLIAVLNKAMFTLFVLVIVLGFGGDGLSSGRPARVMVVDMSLYRSSVRMHAEQGYMLMLWEDITASTPRGVHTVYPKQAL
jgi:hypothetical protein